MRSILHCKLKDLNKRLAILVHSRFFGTVLEYTYHGTDCEFRVADTTTIY